jgi:hypothetical protein
MIEAGNWLSTASATVAHVAVSPLGCPFRDEQGEAFAAVGSGLNGRLSQSEKWVGQAECESRPRRQQAGEAERT